MLPKPAIAEYFAVEFNRGQAAGAAVRLFLRPVRALVAPGLADGICPERVMRQHRVQGIDNQLVMAVSDDLELVFDSGSLGKLDRCGPEVGVREGLAVRQVDADRDKVSRAQPLAAMGVTLLATLGPLGFPFEPVPGSAFRAGLASTSRRQGRRSRLDQRGRDDEDETDE